MRKMNLTAVNGSKIEQLFKTVKRTVDMMVSGSQDGMFNKPTSGKELEEFNSTVNEIVVNKLRNKLGV